MKAGYCHSLTVQFEELGKSTDPIQFFIENRGEDQDEGDFQAFIFMVSALQLRSALVDIELEYIEAAEKGALIGLSPEMVVK